MQLKNLEKDIGAKLLIRSNKGVKLTEEGKVLYNYASTILSIKGNIERDIKNLQQDMPRLIIGSCTNVGDYALPCSIFIFKKHYKEVDINMEVTNSSGVIKKLCDHSINIGIIQDDCKEDSIATKYIASDELILVGSKDSELICDNETISIEELKKIPLILREKTSNTRYLIEKSFKDKKISLEDLNVIYDLNSPGAIKSSISAGNGFAFLPRLIVDKELKKGTLKQINVDGIKIEFNYYVASRKNYSFTEYEQLFVNFIISQKRGFC